MGEMMKPGIGRLVAHDPKSRNYPAKTAPARTVLWAHNAPVLDQESFSACTGFALAQLLNTTRFAAARPRRRYLTAQNALDLYSAATAADEFEWQWPPDDLGSSGLGVCKAGVQLGYLTEYRHAFGLEHMLEALQTQPVIVGTAWYADMTWLPVDGHPARPTGENLGGHEYLCLGANLRAQTLTFLNSWGSAWGDRGRFRISFDDFTTLLADDGDVTVPTLKGI